MLHVRASCIGHSSTVMWPGMLFSRARLLQWNVHRLDHDQQLWFLWQHLCHTYQRYSYLRPRYLRLYLHYRLQAMQWRLHSE